MKKLYYFGPIGKAGHYLWKTQDGQDSYYSNKDIPKSILGDGKLDGGFCPKIDVVNGEVKITQLDGWTIFSWWDRSVDSRPGSHSTFVGTGFDNIDDFLKEANTKFPAVFLRQRVKLKF